MIKKIKLFENFSFGNFFRIFNISKIGYLKRSGNKFRMTLILLFLTSCSLGGATLSSTDGLTSHSGDGYSMSIPSSWDVLTDSENIIPKPSHGKIELSVRSKDTKGGFSNNLLVLSTGLTQTITSKDFALGNSVGAETDYRDYKKIEAKDFSFEDKESGYIHIFEGRYNQNTPVIKFLQTARVCDKKAFLITIALGLDNIDYTKYEKMLGTLSCG